VQSRRLWQDRAARAAFFDFGFPVGRERHQRKFEQQSGKVRAGSITASALSASPRLRDPASAAKATCGVSRAQPKIAQPDSTAINRSQTRITRPMRWSTDGFCLVRFAKAERPDGGFLQPRGALFPERSSASPPVPQL